MLSAGLLLFGLVQISAGQSPPVQILAPVQTYAVDGPTIVAFYRHVTDAEMEKNPDVNEALGDFQLYATQVAPKLRALGIDFEVASATRFKLRIGKRIREFRAREADVGYYFIAPSKGPHVEYGVMTDVDLVEAARAYFSIDARRR